MGNALGTPPSGPKALPRNENAGDGHANKRRTFTLAELAHFDGTTDDESNPKGLIYIAVRGTVYDVSGSRELYGPDGDEHAFAGKDVSRAFALNSNEYSDLKTWSLDDLTEEQLETLDKRERAFQEDLKYPDVGRVITKQDFTREELRKFTAADEPRGTVLVALDGTIYDVTLNGLAFYGRDGMYEQFAGRDASRALALMSFDLECLDDPHVDDLTAEQREVLDEWTERYQQKYAVVGHLSS